MTSRLTSIIVTPFAFSYCNLLHYLKNKSKYKQIKYLNLVRLKRKTNHFCSLSDTSFHSSFHSFCSWLYSSLPLTDTHLFLLQLISLSCSHFLLHFISCFPSFILRNPQLSLPFRTSHLPKAAGQTVVSVCVCV